MVNVGSAQWDVRPHDWATWQKISHYTTAQLEKRWWGGVEATSGRVKGWNGTEAVSPWRRIGEVNPYVARTYYGT